MLAKGVTQERTAHDVERQDGRMSTAASVLPPMSSLWYQVASPDTAKVLVTDACNDLRSLDSIGR